MTKKEYVIYNSIALALFNIIFWTCNSYPRHLIDRSSHVLTASVINAILFLIHFFLLFVFFSSDSTLFGKRLFPQKVCICSLTFRIILLLSIQLLSELFIQFFEEKRYINISTISNLVVLIVWLIEYFVITFNKPKIKFSKTTVTIVMSIIVISVICIFIDTVIVADFQKYCIKYRQDSSHLAIILTNRNFLHSIITLIYDSFIACSLVIFHASRIYGTVKDSVNHNELHEPRLSIRIFVMFVAAFILAAAKATIFPPSSFETVDASISISQVYTDDNRFHKNIYDLKLYRIGDNNQSELCYGFKNVILLCDNKKIAYYTSPFVDDAECVTEYEVGDNKVSVYGNSAICYIENDVPFVVLFEDIHKLKNNPVIIDVCKKLISEGNVIVFEYAVEYLQQYDPDFILPYIIRYSNGEFNTLELNTLDEFEYRIDYLCNIANSVK